LCQLFLINRLGAPPQRLGAGEQPFAGRLEVAEVARIGAPNGSQHEIGAVTHKERAVTYHGGTIEVESFSETANLLANVIVGTAHFDEVIENEDGLAHGAQLLDIVGDLLPHLPGVSGSLVADNPDFDEALRINKYFIDHVSPPCKMYYPNTRTRAVMMARLSDDKLDILYRAITPALVRASIGHFDSDIEIKADNDPRVNELLVGVQVLLDAINEKVHELEEANAKLAESRDRSVTLLDDVLKKSLD
jgi:hypothetical protein